MKHKELYVTSLYDGCTNEIKQQLYLVFLYNKVYIKELKGKVSKIYRGGGLCAVFLGGVDHFKNLRGGGHALAEGSRLSVPAPRRVQIFFQVWWRVAETPKVR